MSKTENLKEIKNLRRINIFLRFIFLAVFPIPMLLVYLISPELNRYLPYIFIPTWFLISSYFYFKQATVRCPNCNSTFFRQGFLISTFTKTCQHCEHSIEDEKSGD
jgi:hypothetical protein